MKGTEPVVGPGIAVPPTSFNLAPFGEVWLHWNELVPLLFPGRGKARPQALRMVGNEGGIYLLAWSIEKPRELSPADRSVKYIGETDRFFRRMGQFGCAAGMWEGQGAHSGGARWPKGRCEKLWVLMFPMPKHGYPKHLATGLRKWMEALALDAHFRVAGRLPDVNLAKGTFDPES